MFRYSKQSNYRRSNAITTVSFPASDRAKHLASQILRSASEDDRQTLGNALLAELSAMADIDAPKLKISGARQYHKKYNGRTVFKQYGYYRPASNYIYITNRTAIRGKILAPKTFVTTLLHEWLHHYDTRKLKLVSIHTAGFYARLKDVKIRLGLT